MYQLITVQRYELSLNISFHETLEEARNTALTSIQFLTGKNWDDIISSEDDSECSYSEQDSGIMMKAETSQGTMIWKIIKVPENDRISVNTPAGTFIAKINNDEVYPGISVFKDTVFPDNMLSATEYDPNEEQIKIEAYAKDIDEPIVVIEHETGKNLM